MFINVTNSSGETPLFFACFTGYLDVVKLLVENGATINVKNNDEETPLIYAVKKGDYSIVNYLVSKEASLDDKDKNGNTALMLACIIGRKAPNREDYIKCASILIDNGANVNVQNEDGNTALSYAIMLPCYSIIESIIHKSNMEVESIL
jgi:ankyrin repeat protein